MSLIDLGATLRALRRAADLSQRQLAERTSVPQSTVSRIEAGEYTNPTFRTVERLIEAAGGTLTVVAAGSQQPAVEPVPHEALTDVRGRHYPAHLDVLVTFPMIGPDWTLLDAGTPVRRFHVRRQSRDQRRAELARAMALTIEREEISQGRAWVWTARTVDDAAVATLCAQTWPRTVVLPWENIEAVVCRLAVAPGWQGTGVEHRLLADLRDEIGDLAFADVITLAYPSSDTAYLRELGFHPARKLLTTLRIDLHEIVMET